MYTNNEKHYYVHMCPECGCRVHDQMEIFINECDRCLAEKAE